MEHPDKSAPKRLVIEITEAGAAVQKAKTSKSAAPARTLGGAIAAARGSTEPPQTRVGFGR